ncbi:hypothetical protein IF1G_01161 [Cordyceps javanica]|uniref:Uncharacterized protein n=1 Tax=Cordyceps javanica TaxID=43265 RepID=A0A545VHV8_9HYPO|nr:hypothetical protein IF1G_01161 [Cordyceps javanica]
MSCSDGCALIDWLSIHDALSRIWIDTASSATPSWHPVAASWSICISGCTWRHNFHAQAVRPGRSPIATTISMLINALRLHSLATTNRRAYTPI